MLSLAVKYVPTRAVAGGLLTAVEARSGAAIKTEPAEAVQLLLSFDSMFVEVSSAQASKHTFPLASLPVWSPW